MKRLLPFLFVLILLIMAGYAAPAYAENHVQPGASLKLTTSPGDRPLIIDHQTVDITKIPLEWIEEAKSTLSIYYGHTSHGSQLISGMEGLISFANHGGLGLALPQNAFAGLAIKETGRDAGYYPIWVEKTREYLGDPDPATGRGTANPDTNVVIWSWCGQVSDISPSRLVDEYLSPMTRLEEDYPAITFVYMTGHADGSGDDPAQSNWSSPPAFESGAGGLVSTVDDLYAFGQMLLNKGTYGETPPSSGGGSGGRCGFSRGRRWS